MSEPKKLWSVYAKVTTGVFVGHVKAATQEEAESLGWDNVETPVLCHHCSKGFGDFDVEEIEVFEETQP